MTGTRRQRLQRRLLRVVDGPARRPLEPHRPLPHLLRATSWLTTAVGFALLTPVALLIDVGVPLAVGTGLSIAAITTLAVAVLLRVGAALARPVPLDLAARDEQP